MKTLLSSALIDYAAPERTIAKCWNVVRTDGEMFGFTDHDQPITIGGVTYEALSGFTASQLVTNATLSVDNMELEGLFDSTGITDAELEAGVWDNAEIVIFEANYETRTWTNILLTGWLGQFKRNGGLFVAELRSLTSPLQKTVGDMITPNCRYKLGDADCKVDLDAITEFDVPVTTVTTRRIFIAASLIGDTRQFNWGVVTFTTGPNAGFSMDVKSFDPGTGTIELQLPFPYEVSGNDNSPADEFSIAPGCNKKSKTAVGVYDGDCITFYDNMINFGGEPEVPLPSKSFRLPGG